MGRIALYGGLTGLGLVALLALADRLVVQNPFGVATGLVGAVAGGLMLLLGFLMAVISYQLASRGRAVELRRRLLVSAVFTGAAGMVSGTAAILVWLLAGRPFFP